MTETKKEAKTEAQTDTKTEVDKTQTQEIELAAIMGFKKAVIIMVVTQLTTQRIQLGFRHLQHRILKGLIWKQNFKT